MHLKRKHIVIVSIVGIFLGGSTVEARRHNHLPEGISGGIIGASIVHLLYQNQRDHYRKVDMYERYRYRTQRRHPARYRGERCTYSTTPTRDIRGRQHHSRPRKTHHTDTKKANRHHTKRPVMQTANKKRPQPLPLLKSLTDAQKIQRGLKGLGFYQGAIDGELHSYQTHTAIRSLYSSYGENPDREPSRSLKKQLKRVGELFMMDHALIAKSHTKDAQIKQLQTALKILGFYHGEIDGLVGSQTKNAIRSYLESTELDSDSRLNLESKYYLVKNAKIKHEKSIEETIEKLRQSIASNIDETWHPEWHYQSRR